MRACMFAMLSPATHVSRVRGAQANRWVNFDFVTLMEELHTATTYCTMLATMRRAGNCQLAYEAYATWPIPWAQNMKRAHPRRSPPGPAGGRMLKGPDAQSPSSEDGPEHVILSERRWAMDGHGEVEYAGGTF